MNHEGIIEEHAAVKEKINVFLPQGETERLKSARGSSGALWALGWKKIAATSSFDFLNKGKLIVEIICLYIYVRLYVFCIH